MAADGAASTTSKITRTVYGGASLSFGCAISEILTSRSTTAALTTWPLWTVTRNLPDLGISPRSSPVPVLARLIQIDAHFFEMG